jgi:hypothetical protein
MPFLESEQIANALEESAGKSEGRGGILDIKVYIH